MIAKTTPATRNIALIHGGPIDPSIRVVVDTRHIADIMSGISFILFFLPTAAAGGANYTVDVILVPRHEKISFTPRTDRLTHMPPLLFLLKLGLKLSDALPVLLTPFF